MSLHDKSKFAARKTSQPPNLKADNKVSLRVAEDWYTNDSQISNSETIKMESYTAHHFYRDHK